MTKEKYFDDSQDKKSVNSAFFDGSRHEPFKLTRFIYNRREGTVLGRNSESWGKIKSINCLIIFCFVVVFLSERVKFHRKYEM